MSTNNIIKASLFKKYDKCIYCNSKNLKKEKTQVQLNNFYLKSIKSDLGLSSKHLRKMKVYKCQKCFILQCNPWFSENIARKIYSNIYGQHNRGWSNLIDYKNKGIFPDHGRLFYLLMKNLKSLFQRGKKYINLVLANHHFQCQKK